MDTPNTELVAQLKTALRLAEQGKITDGVVIALGPEMEHHTFSIPNAPNLLIGEMVLIQQVIGMRVINDRAKQQPRGVVTPGPRILQG